MTFKEYKAPEKKVYTYDGIRVSMSGISKTIAIEKLVRNWCYVRIFFDKDSGVIKLQKSAPGDVGLAFKIKWGNAINIKIYREMPQGRYLLIEETNDSLVFKKE